MAEALTVLSAFTGLGGLDLGLEAAGFASVGCIEFDDEARRSLKANRAGEWPVLATGDISEVVVDLTPESVGLEVGELTLLAGGPPCQPFSKAAQWAPTARAGLKDTRSHSLEDFLAVLEILLPRALLIENVSGFVQGPVSALPSIHRRLQSINEKHGTSYSAQMRIVDAAAYGVPQHRKRAIIVATRDGEAFSWPKETHATRFVTAWDAIGDLELEEPPPRCAGRWADLLPSIPEGHNYLWHTDRGGGLPLFGYRTRFWSFLLKLKKSLPSWTLPASPGPSTGPFHWDNRPLAVPELLRLQSFPADWLVEGDHRARVRQVGNATPPLLAEVVGRSLAKDLTGQNYRGVGLTHGIGYREKTPRASRRKPVPERYLPMIGDHPPHPGTGKGPNPRDTAE